MTAPDPYTGEHGGAEPNVALAQQLLDRCLSLLEGSPAWRYLTETRGLPARAVHYCSQDLRVLEPPIGGFDRLAYAVVSLLRNKDGEITGLAVEAVGPGGQRLLDGNGRTARKTYALRRRGQIDTTFRVQAAGADALFCYMAEGRLAKPIAIAAILEDPAIYGWGGLNGLGYCLPAESTVVVVEDRCPDDAEAAARHEAAMERGVDRLILGGKMVLRAGGPPCTCCKDADEALGKHPVEELRAWLAAAAPAALSLDGEAKRCAKIKDPLKQAQAILEAIERLGLKAQPGMTTAFRKAVNKYAGRHDADHGAEDGEELQGAAVVFEDILPWPEAVDGAELIADIEAFITARAVVPPFGPLACALWVLHAHAHDAAYHSPRLVLRSPTKGCGKSTVRRVLSRLTPRAYEAVDITGPTFFRPINQWRPTVFVDEGNELNWGEARDLTSVINSGHCRDDPGVPRCVGPDFEVRMFPVWAPLCLALIGFLPSTITERAITIEMRKKLRGNTIQRQPRRDRDEAAHVLARRAARWAVDHVITLENADPALPPALGDRPADNWRPLLAIADLVERGEDARTAAIALSLTDDDGEDVGVQLLSDIHEVFEVLKKEHLPSGEIIGKLIQMEGRPWAEYGKMRGPMSPNGMARLLKPFKIRPQGSIRVGDKTAKGYARTAFEAAWKQYSIPQACPANEQPAQRHDPGAEPVSSDSQPAHAPDDVTDGIGPKATDSATCAGVPDADWCGPPNGEDIGHQAGHGNGANPDAAPAGACCVYCGASLDGALAEPTTDGGGWMHSGPCHAASAQPPEPPAKPKRRRSRIKGADTTPGVEELPS